MLDTVTNLIWQRVPSNQTMTFNAAQSYCQELNMGGLSWRLPTVKELSTLADFTVNNPAIDANVFPQALSVSQWYWTSTSYSASSGNVVWVDFSAGNGGYSVPNVAIGARCVSSSNDFAAGLNYDSRDNVADSVSPGNRALLSSARSAFNYGVVILAMIPMVGVLFDEAIEVLNQLTLIPGFRR